MFIHILSLVSLHFPCLVHEAKNLLHIRICRGNAGQQRVFVAPQQFIHSAGSEEAAPYGVHPDGHHGRPEKTPFHLVHYSLDKWKQGERCDKKHTNQLKTTICFHFVLLIWELSFSTHPGRYVDSGDGINSWITDWFLSQKHKAFCVVSWHPSAIFHHGHIGLCPILPVQNIKYYNLRCKF